MEALLTRYRNLTVLLIAFFAQLVLIAFQVRTGKDVPLLRVWAITAVTPVEQALEFVRRNTIGVAEDYFVLVGVRSENERLKKQMGELKLQNHYLQSELSTADRVHALSAFQVQSPSKMLAARIIGNGTGTNPQVVFIDRGSGSDVEAGMAVITPDGIVGKVIDSYPTAALVMLVTDPSFAAGVISQKNHTRGTLKGQGQPQALVDYVQNEQKVEAGEMFFTSGDDRIFPKGFPVGKAEVVKNGKTFKQIFISPAAFQGGLEEVLVVLEGAHQPIPELEIPSPGIKMMPPPPDAAATAGQATAGNEALSTEADRLKAQYKSAGDAQNHVFGDGNLRPPDFTKLGQPPPTPKPVAVPGVAVPAKTGDVRVSAVTPLQTPASLPKPAPATAAAKLTDAPKPNAAAPLVPVGTTSAKPPAGDALKAKPTIPDAAAMPPKPKPRGPLLVTDPNDANPELNAPSNNPKAKQQNP
jgi:rod shape-determining protein MreC